MAFILNLFFCLAVFTIIKPGYTWPIKADKIRGVNLGGWLILEKWMTPNVFSGLPDDVNDEYKLTKYLGKQQAEQRLRSHWDTWVTEADIVKFKNAGINHVRIPLGYWTFDIRNGEPWVSGSWDYAVKAAGWCKKYGLQVMMDLHGAPGSQNGNDHSGQSGSIGFFYNDDNLNRATAVVRQIAQWANATEWRETISTIQVLNEPVLWEDYWPRLAKLKQYYRMAYDAVRSVNSIAIVAVHDAFIGYDNWYYLRDDPHYWWVMLDTHLYQVFGLEYQTLTCKQHETVACKKREELSKANEKLWTVVGEWSLATPRPCNNQAILARQQIGVWEGSASGWFFWSHENAQGWREWSMKRSLDSGWIKPSQNNVASC